LLPLPRLLPLCCRDIAPAFDARTNAHVCACAAQPTSCAFVRRVQMRVLLPVERTRRSTSWKAQLRSTQQLLATARHASGRARVSWVPPAPRCSVSALCASLLTQQHPSWRCGEPGGGRTSEAWTFDMTQRRVGGLANPAALRRKQASTCACNSRRPANQPELQ
jgi:hypothetical protein